MKYLVFRASGTPSTVTLVVRSSSTVALNAVTKGLNSVYQPVMSYYTWGTLCMRFN